MTQTEFKKCWDVLLINYGREFDKKVFLIYYEAFKDTHDFNKYLIPIMKEYKFFPNIYEIERIISIENLTGSELVNTNTEPIDDEIFDYDWLNDDE